MKMYTEAHLEPNQTSMVKSLCENQKKLYFKCSTVSKYASGIGFTVEVCPYVTLDLEILDIILP